MEESREERQGCDEASGHSYRVISTTSLLGDDISPVQGLRIHFAQTNSSFNDRYHLQLSGWISPRHRDAITVFFQRHGVPSAALNTFLDLIFGVRVFLVDTIKANVDIEAFNYVPPPDLDVNLDEETTISLLEDELNGALQILRIRHVLRSGNTRDVVDALEKVTIRSETSCAVCLDEFLLGSVATKMPCSHVFHGDCIVQWFEKKYDCPLCRFELQSAS